MDFSVVLPTYHGDDPDTLAVAIQSLANQTRSPDELLIVEDGPLTEELTETISKQAETFPGIVRTHRISTNQGLGNALRVGVEQSSNDLVARMDADDISVPARFEQQIDFLHNNPEVDIVGGQIEEFDTNPDEPIASREVPTTHDGIMKMARHRSPMNHATVMFDKDVVLEAGNYRAVDRMEDYGLWIRMLLNGARFANIPAVLLKVRAGENMHGRRGGWEYAREEVRIQTQFYRQGFTTLPEFLFNVTTRTTLRMLPNRVRGEIYKRLTRG